MSKHYILTLTCPDRTGIVARVSQFIADNKGNINEANQHGEISSQWFFMRVVIDADSLSLDLPSFQKAFRPIANEFEMDWQICDASKKKKVVILVSKYDHCLSDLLYRWRSREFDFDIPCVISNHDDLRSFVQWHEIPYFHVPVDSQNKDAAFEQIQKLYDEHGGDVMVLARYMQVLPADMCRQYKGEIINIHHSFLPSFVGAKPYQHAFERGVKLIGATCHYVSEELDAGPIIEQDVVRVNHSHNTDDLIRLGKDVEKNVLAKGLRYHIQNRVLTHNNKTIVFD